MSRALKEKSWGEQPARVPASLRLAGVREGVSEGLIQSKVTDKSHQGESFGKRGPRERSRGREGSPNSSTAGVPRIKTRKNQRRDTQGILHIVALLSEKNRTEGFGQGGSGRRSSVRHTAMRGGGPALLMGNGACYRAIRMLKVLQQTPPGKGLARRVASNEGGQSGGSRVEEQEKTPKTVRPGR